MANLVFLGGVAVALVAMAGIARWAKGRGSGVAGAVAAYEEAYRTTAYQSHHELRVAADRKSETGTPDDL